MIWQRERHGQDYMKERAALTRSLRADEVRDIIVVGTTFAALESARSLAQNGTKITILHRKESAEWILKYLEGFEVECIHSCKDIETEHEDDLWIVAVFIDKFWIVFRAKQLIHYGWGDDGSYCRCT